MELRGLHSASNGLTEEAIKKLIEEEVEVGLTGRDIQGSVTALASQLMDMKLKDYESGIEEQLVAVRHRVDSLGARVRVIRSRLPPAAEEAGTDGQREEDGDDQVAWMESQELPDRRLRADIADLRERLPSDWASKIQGLSSGNFVPEFKGFSWRAAQEVE